MTTARRIRGVDPASGRILDVTLDGDRVVTVTSSGSAFSSETAAHAADDGFLIPGLIDLQVNGFAGCDVNGPDVTAEVIVELVRALAASGTTTVVPTVVTAAEVDIVRSLRAVADARAADAVTRVAVPYVHVEGPHISIEDGARGAHPAEHVRPPDVGELRRWQQAADGVVGMVTLSPHHAQAPAYTAAATQAGIHVAVGHTAATPEQVTAVIDAGAVLSTHLGNGIPAMMPRHPNQVWTQLADDRLTAGYIADGHHLPADTLRAMVRAKGPARSLLVSDSVALAGLPPGTYDSPVGGRVELTADGRLGQVGTPYLAGAARTLADGVAGAAAMAQIPLGVAVGMATATPGRFVGGSGVLRPGASADLLRVAWRPGDATLTLLEVVQQGRVVSGGGPPTHRPSA